jgi:hypothetical protein
VRPKRLEETLAHPAHRAVVWACVCSGGQPQFAVWQNDQPFDGQLLAGSGVGDDAGCTEQRIPREPTTSSRSTSSPIDVRAVVLVRALGQRADRSFDMTVVHVWQLSEGKLASLWLFPADECAFDALWS